MTTGQSNQSGTGLESRLAASALVGIVVDKHASIEDLTDADRGIAAFLNLNHRDQALARAIALATLRHKGRIETILNACWNRKPPQKARFLIHTLEIAAAQTLFMEVPESAAVNLAIRAIKRERSTTRFAGFANAVLRKLARDRDALLENSKHSSLFPQTLEKMLITDYGRKNFQAFNDFIAREPVLDLQVKPGVDISSDKLLGLPGSSYRLDTNVPIIDLPRYQEGSWWIQDIAAAQPAKLLGDVKGQKVADLCAAPGGKTMQLAAAGAQVTSVDISSNRLAILRKNLERTGLPAELVCADILDWKPVETFDAILLDAPCSATGTVRRHPDILWNTTPEDIDALTNLQKKLIEKAATLLKPGGRLIYANCSLLKSEGENLVAQLEIAGLRADPISPEEIPGLDFCVNGRGQFRSLPHFLEIDRKEKSGMDGFFAARFKRSVDR